MLKDSVGYQLKRVQHALRTRMDEVLHEEDLTTPQYSALSVIQESPGLSGNKIAGRCFVTPQTMNLILTNLEQRKLIVRRPHPEFGRILQTYLTPEGERRIRESQRKVKDIEDRMISHLSQEQAIKLAHELGMCADMLGQDSSDDNEM